MSKTHCDISMSLDGFITGPNEGMGNPLGDDDGRLHDCMFARGTEKDTAVLEEAYARTGAILMGKRMFDVGAESWGDPYLAAGLLDEIQIPRAVGLGEACVNAWTEEHRPCLERTQWQGRSLPRHPSSSSPTSSAPAA